MNIIKKYYKKYSHSASKDANIILGRLGDYAGMYGAARLII
jgi:UDP-galactopyranose mutase